MSSGLRSYYISPTYDWFPFVWYDLIERVVIYEGFFSDVRNIPLKHKVSKKEAIAFKKLLQDA